MFNKVTIVGAGHVGSNLAFLLLKSGLCLEINLIDIQKDLAKAIALDLEDCRFSFGSDTKVAAGTSLESLTGSDAVVITAGKPRSPGMSREDLIKTNSKVVGQVSRAIKRRAKKAIIIVITNPLDIMTYVALKASGFKRNQVIGMGSSLDCARFANLLSKKTRVSVGDIDPVVFGAHGKNMLVSSQASVGGVSLTSFLKAKEVRALQKQTVERGAAIVGLFKKGSARFGPAAACLEILKAIALDKKNLTFAAAAAKGEYGVKGICLGLPVVIGASGIERVIELRLSGREKKVLARAAKSIKKHIDLL